MYRRRSIQNQSRSTPARDVSFPHLTRRYDGMPAPRQEQDHAHLSLARIEAESAGLVSALDPPWAVRLVASHQAPLGVHEGCSVAVGFCDAKQGAPQKREDGRGNHCACWI